MNRFGFTNNRYKCYKSNESRFLIMINVFSVKYTKLTASQSRPSDILSEDLRICWTIVFHGLHVCYTFLKTRKSIRFELIDTAIETSVFIIINNHNTNE